MYGYEDSNDKVIKVYELSEGHGNFKKNKNNNQDKDMMIDDD